MPPSDILEQQDPYDSSAISAEERELAIHRFKAMRRLPPRAGVMAGLRFIDRIIELGPLIGSAALLPEVMKANLPDTITTIGQWVYQEAASIHVKRSTTIQTPLFNMGVGSSGPLTEFDDKKELYQVMIGLLVGKVPQVAISNDSNLQGVIWRHIHEDPINKENKLLGASHRLAATLLEKNHECLGSLNTVILALNLLHSPSRRAREQAARIFDETIKEIPCAEFKAFCVNLRYKGAEELQMIFCNHAKTSKVLAEFLQGNPETQIFPMHQAFKGQKIPHPWPEHAGQTRHHATLNRGVTAFTVIADYVVDAFDRTHGRRPNRGISLTI